jgi:hypothetical protein
MNIEMTSASSARMSIRTKIGHPYETSTEETSTEAKIGTTPAETPIDIVMTTRTHPLGAMTVFLRPRGTAVTPVGNMVESTFGWCSNIEFGRAAHQRRLRELGELSVRVTLRSTPLRNKRNSTP